MFHFRKRQNTSNKVETLRIHLIGWYGQGGLADDIIEHCIETVFSEEASNKAMQLEFVDSLDCDLIIIGGGSLLGFDCLKISKKIQKARSPVVVFGTGFRREKRTLDAFHQKSTSRIIEKASLTGVRGFLSKMMFLHNGIPIDDMEVIGDPALLFKPVPVDDFDGGFKVGMVVRHVSHDEAQYVTNERTQQILSVVADDLIKRHSARIFFFSFTENSNESDLEGAGRAIAMMRHKEHTEIVPRTNDCIQLCSMLGKMDLIVSQRLHPSLLGWVQGVPNIAFEYQFNKTLDSMNTLGMDEFVIRTDEFVLENYLKKLEALFTAKQHIIAQSQNAIHYWRMKQRAFAKRCIELAMRTERNGKSIL